MAPRVVFHVTGFGPFQGVVTNPTSVMVPQLPCSPNPSDGERYCIGSTTVFETSGEGSLEQLNKLYDEARAAAQPGDRLVFLHFGVATMILDFQLERTAWNEATFRVPDERGWSPIEQPIASEEPDLRHALQCKLDLTFTKSVLEAQGFATIISDDPGRFVCNWVYYHSNQRTRAKPDEFSLFVHVPSFSTRAVEEQLTFIRALLSALAHQVLDSDTSH